VVGRLGLAQKAEALLLGQVRNGSVLPQMAGLPAPGGVAGQA